MTLTELLDWLKTMDEVTLLELLELSSEDLVERFVDRVEERYAYLAAERELLND